MESPMDLWKKTRYASTGDGHRGRGGGGQGDGSVGVEPIGYNTM